MVHERHGGCARIRNGEFQYLFCFLFETFPYQSTLGSCLFLSILIDLLSGLESHFLAPVASAPDPDFLFPDKSDISSEHFFCSLCCCWLSTGFNITWQGHWSYVWYLVMLIYQLYQDNKTNKLKTTETCLASRNTDDQDIGQCFEGKIKNCSKVHLPSQICVQILFFAGNILVTFISLHRELDTALRFNLH